MHLQGTGLLLPVTGLRLLVMAHLLGTLLLLPGAILLRAGIQHLPQAGTLLLRQLQAMALTRLRMRTTLIRRRLLAIPWERLCMARK